MAIKRGVPGVGHYEDQLGLDSTGTYNQNSQWSNSKAQKWAPSYDRFKVPNTTSQLTPGPGQHDTVGDLSHSTQVNSNFHNIKTPSFGIGGRAKWGSRNNTPGPGSYRPPSDFGYVDIILKTRLNQYGGNKDSGTFGKHRNTITNMSYNPNMTGDDVLELVKEQNIELDTFEIREVARSPHNHPRTATKKQAFGRKSTIGAQTVGTSSRLRNTSRTRFMNRNISPTSARNNIMNVTANEDMRSL